IPLRARSSRAASRSKRAPDDARACDGSRCGVRDSREHARRGRAGAWVDRPRFLNDDETLAVALPELPDGECTTVVLLGARGLGFHVRLGEGRDDDPNARVPSEAGALSIERCGATLPRRLLVTSDSGRGALE